MNTQFHVRHGRATPCRRPLLVFSIGLLLLSLAIATVPDATAQTAPVQFDVDPEVSAEDELLVVEAIRLAHDFFTETIGATIDEPLQVSITTEANDDADTVAVAIGDWIIVYTGSTGWQALSPAEKVAVIVHEYTHFYQFLKSGHDHADSPIWFEEGIAEYLGYESIHQLDILDKSKLESFQLFVVEMTAEGLGLRTLESADPEFGIVAEAYPLSHLGVARLFDSVGLQAVENYYTLLESGMSVDKAFFSAFGVTMPEHYVSFDTWMDETIGEFSIPSDIEVVEGVVRASPVELEKAPFSVSAGEQILILAQTDDGSVCALDLETEERLPVGETRTTHADGDGDVFWLVTLPANLDTERLAFEIGCGAAPVTWTVAA